MIILNLQNRVIKAVLILALSLFLALAFQAAAHAATLRLEPKQQSIDTDGFVVDIILDTEGEAIGGVEANLTYPKDLVQATNLLYSDSAFDYTIKSFRKNGTIEVHRAVVDDPAPNGTNVVVARIAFEFLSNSSPSSVQFADSSNVFRDSDGQEVLSATSGGEYTYVPPPAPESGATGDPEGSASAGQAGSPAQSNLTATNADHAGEEQGENVLLDEDGNPIETGAEQFSQTNPSQIGSGNTTSRLVGALVIAGLVALLAAAVYITQKRGLIRLPFLKSAGSAAPQAEQPNTNPDAPPGTVVEPKDDRDNS